MSILGQSVMIYFRLFRYFWCNINTKTHPMKAKKEDRLDLQEKSWPTQELFKKSYEIKVIYLWEQTSEGNCTFFFPVMGQLQGIFKGRTKLIKPHTLLLGAHSAFSGRANQTIIYFEIRLRHLKNACNFSPESTCHHYNPVWMVMNLK